MSGKDTQESQSQPPMPQDIGSDVKCDGEHHSIGAATGFGLAGVLLVVATTSFSSLGCPAYDETADGGVDTGFQELPGHTVSCCYSGTFDTLGTPDQYFFCLGGIPECIDESEGTALQTLANFCAQKCTPSWDAGTVGMPPATFYDENFDFVVPTATAFDSCVVLPPESEIYSTILQENACTPRDPPPFGVGADVGPQYGAFFSDSDGSLDIEVAGAEVTAEYDLSMHFALSNCQGGGIDGGTCDLVVSGFDASLQNVAVSGEFDYQVDAAITLSQNAVAEVFFEECTEFECYGEFQFSAAEENPLHLDLTWLQVNLSTLSTAVGAVHLANDGEALGGVDVTYGSLHLDPNGAEYGVINMSGEGEDSFGGDFAEATFMVYGYVAMIDDEIGDCCEEDLSPGGCSNKYISTCVSVRETSCYTTEWDESCVLAVDGYGCAVCPVP